MKTKIFLIIVLSLLIFACNKKQDETVNTDSINQAKNEVSSETSSDDYSVEIDALKNEILQLTNDSNLKNDEINQLKAEISSKDELISNMQLAINKYKSSKNTLIYFQVISVILNILLIILLIKPKRFKKRLALPFIKDKDNKDTKSTNKETESNNTETNVTKTITDTDTTKVDNQETSSNVKRGRPAKNKSTTKEDDKNLNKEKVKRGRPPKNQTK